MWHVLVVSVLSLSGFPVEVKPLSGPTVSGELIDLTAQAAIVQTANGRQTLDLSGLWEIAPSQPASPPRDAATVWVELVDGSQLHATQFTVTQGVASLTWASGQTAAVPTRSIHSVRWRDHGQTPDLAKQWSDLAAQKLDADIVVVRRTNNLDQLEGVLHDVTAESVQFQFQDQRLDVNRKKLDGLVYYHPAAGDYRQRLCQVTDATASQWNVKSLRFVEGQLELVTAAGMKVLLPAKQLMKVNFSSGNTVWLSDLEPETMHWRPYVDSQLPQPLLTKLFQPRKDQSFSGGSLLLGGIVYPRGVAIRSRTELVYRLTEDFRQFHAVVGIDDRVREGGNVDLKFSGDERVLLSKNITGRDPPLTVDLDITGVKRLKILVDFGQELDIADHLDLCEARLTK
jgi:NPCBM/NEW2 domain